MEIIPISPVPWCGNDMVTNESSIRDGLMAVQADTVKKLTGRNHYVQQIFLKNTPMYGEIGYQLIGILNRLTEGVEDSWDSKPVKTKEEPGKD